MKRSALYFTLILGLTALVYSCGSAYKGLASGTPAPELEGKAPDGTVYKLSDYQGKIVLVDFWASWCPPCRAANPEVAELYEKYHGQEFEEASDFEIFSVSLDDKKSSWEAAIAKDKLVWPAHICDFKRWESDLAAKYKVQAIPTSFLLDANGQIIGRDLSPSEVAMRLKKMMK